jgi:hypothetical protein
VIEYPHCEICDAGGIAANDCPNCRGKAMQYRSERIAEALHLLDLVLSQTEPWEHLPFYHVRLSRGWIQRTKRVLKELD